MKQATPSDHLDPKISWLDMLLFNNCEPEERLDYITRDAVSLLKVPIAMINLVTSDAVIFKSCVGQVQGDQLERNGAFCSKAVSQDTVLVIPDTTLDETFKSSELVVGPMQIRSYMGKSLHAPDGTRVGTICVLDTKTRHYTKLQQAGLHELALLADAQLAAILGGKKELVSSAVLA